MLKVTLIRFQITQNKGLAFLLFDFLKNFSYYKNKYIYIYILQTHLIAVITFK